MVIHFFVVFGSTALQMSHSSIQVVLICVFIPLQPRHSGTCPQQPLGRRRECQGRLPFLPRTQHSRENLAHP